MVERCGWCGDDPLYVDYHDREWGVPERDPRALWEALTLEAFQAGLSWITILRKREGFRQEFDGFDPERVAAWDQARIDRAMGNPGIIRHRAKIEAAVRGARSFLRIEDERGFSPWLWGVVGGDPIRNSPADLSQVPAQTPESQAMSKALKSEGFGFCGPVITYAFMQATGMVDDHVATCHRHGAISPR
ncbi:DNA-3-methyladenine glycosylase I [Paracoccus zeaxanthinifaciens]|uniref:DNA-3-methyladenine glycosylase I n=1 Tax=Paracoccus zeaxanthinifaciens TaxID=187400 RepID=UPI0003B57326|nr:DNA-3-methyladenine glycosylase I [Paracoccus zeaxanthinifaciens]